MTLVVGIDYDSFALHLCGLPDDGGPPVTHTSPLRRRNDDSIVAITSVSGALASALNHLRLQRPAIECITSDGVRVGQVSEGILGIWVERGYGANRNVDFLMGAIYGGIFAAANACAPGVPVRPAHSNKWKKHLGVAGNAKKDLANAAAAERWSEEWPLAIIPQDPNLLDAFGVALYASTL